MLLRDLAAADRDASGRRRGRSTITGLAADSRAVGARLSVRRAARLDDRRRQLRRRCGRSAARSRSSPPGRRRSMPTPASPSSSRRSAAGAGAGRGALLSRSQPEQLVAVTGTSGKTSVAAFTRQIFASAGTRPRASARSASSAAGWSDLWQPDDARPGRAARGARPARRRGRHPRGDGGLEPRPRPAPARRRPPRRGRPSPISAATTWTITRPSRTISPPSCGCSARCCPTDGAAVIDIDDDRVGRRSWPRRRGAAIALIRVGRAGRELRIVDIARERLRASGSASRPSAGGHEVVLPLAGAFQASNALVAAGLAIARRRRRRGRARGARQARGRARPAGAGRPAGERGARSSSTTPTSPTRWRTCSRRCGRSPPAGSSSSSAPAATATAASGR